MGQGSSTSHDLPTFSESMMTDKGKGTAEDPADVKERARLADERNEAA